MERYQAALVALELKPESDRFVIGKAQEVVEQFGTQLTLIHAVEPVANYGAAYGVSAGIDIENVLVDEAKAALMKIGEKLKVDTDHQIVEIGPAKHIILEQAEKLNSGLIIIGSHGYQGVRLLLGSTANAVLHGATCDVLAVRVQG